jgi:hypothetical protein
VFTPPNGCNGFYCGPGLQALRTDRLVRFLEIKIRFKELASRLTGVSLPVFGVSWNPPEPERKIVRETLVFLEDRRALYNDFAHEIEDQVAQSVLQIRTELTNAIRRLSEDAEAASSFRAMRAACREYLTDTSHRSPRFFGAMAELGRLRGIFGIHVAYLAIKYGIDIEGDLSSIIPLELRETLPNNEEN